MSSSQYDFVIIGAGAAGLNLALLMLEEEFFKTKRILILDKSEKNEDDRTWSFWEKGKGQFDYLITKSWNRGIFYSKDEAHPLDLGEYNYKTLHGLTFYEYCRKKISEGTNIDWVQDQVREVEEKDDHVLVKGSTANYRGTLILDSRVDAGYFATTDQDRNIRLIQHFKGYFVKTSKPVFDPETFTLMDYRLRHPDSTSFTYLLPTSPYESLVEFTLFNHELLEDQQYDDYLKAYFTTYLRDVPYEIQETEFGIIPMSTYPFHQASTRRVVKIGTAGSWVKPSSGYSFMNAQKNARKMVNNLIKEDRVDKGLINPKFRFYDSIFLDVLDKNNQMGPDIFTDMFTKNPPDRIFRFLDEESTFREDIRIMASFDMWPFTKSFFSRVIH